MLAENITYREIVEPFKEFVINNTSNYEIKASIGPDKNGLPSALRSGYTEKFVIPHQWDNWLGSGKQYTPEVTFKVINQVAGVSKVDGSRSFYIEQAFNVFLTNMGIADKLNEVCPQIEFLWVLNNIIGFCCKVMGLNKNQNNFNLSQTVCNTTNTYRVYRKNAPTETLYEKTGYDKTYITATEVRAMVKNIGELFNDTNKFLINNYEITWTVPGGSKTRPVPES